MRAASHLCVRLGGDREQFLDVLGRSGTASSWNRSDGVNRTPVCRPTSLRSTPLADSNAIAEACRSVSSPNTV